MSSAPEESALREAADRLRELHNEPQPLILPNCWDVSSARAVERAGATAIATTSSAVADALGYADGEGTPPEEMFRAVRRIADAVGVPVTADLEGGYGLAADELVERSLSAGAVGLNLEDTDRTPRAPMELLPAHKASRRIAAVRAAAERQGVPLFINARVDVFLRGSGALEELVDQAVSRGRSYLDAGADSVYPIGLNDAEAIGRIVREMDAPVNVLLRPGAPSIGELTSLGVRRISVGGGMARHVDVLVERLARELLAGDGSAFASLGEG